VLLQNFYACSLAYVFAPLLLAVQHGELAGAVEGVEVLDHGPSWRSSSPSGWAAWFVASAKSTSFASRSKSL
jgi:hypothetical protein